MSFLVVGFRWGGVVWIVVLEIWDGLGLLVELGIYFWFWIGTVGEIGIWRLGVLLFLVKFWLLLWFCFIEL